MTFLNTSSRIPRGLDAPRVDIVERAFQLARSGLCGTLTEIGKALHNEGYRNIPAHLEGKAIREALRRARPVAAASGQGEGRPSPDADGSATTGT